MANNAVYTQLPIMVKRPQAVWPGLDQMDLHRNVIAGDGNCLFASLADQLYGSPAQHLDVRSRIIGYMREMREDFEHVALPDDIQQKRATRRDTSVLQSTDSFEGYLTIMSKSGTYGGDPELCAFVRSFDQDVMVHLPRGMEPKSLDYTNPYRAPDAEVKSKLHICYDNKIVNAHYDSARKNGSDSDGIVTKKPSKRQQKSPAESDAALKSRAARNRRADMMKNMMLESLTESGRARSPSIDSSQHSSSSKRSFEDDTEPQRVNKRADRKQSSRGRSSLQPASRLHSTSNKTKLTSGLATPASTQDGDYSSDQSDRSSDPDLEAVRRRPKVQPKSPSRSLSPNKDVPAQTATPLHSGRTIPKRSITPEDDFGPKSAAPPRKGVAVLKQSVTPENKIDLDRASPPRKGMAVLKRSTTPANKSNSKSASPSTGGSVMMERTSSSESMALNRQQV